jgi:mono/diheme cytochrome c family protein
MRKHLLDFALLVFLPWLLLACERERGDPAPDELSTVDTVLVELGGISTEQLSRGQRWRMISSIGAGLPPSSFQEEHLPEPDARGAALLQAYCVQCHWMPAPQMHAAEEWPILLRRMYMRAGALRERMGGPFTDDAMGEILMSGMSSAEVPPAADQDSLLAYLVRNALPTAERDEIGEGEEASLFLARCSVCHEIPSPAAHISTEWAVVVGRMQGNMVWNGVPPLDEAEQARIVRFLQSRAASPNTP